MDPASLFLVAAWWLVGPLLFMLLARTTATGAFVSRYLAFSYPAQALLFTCFGYRLFGAAGSRVWALAAVVLFAGNPLLALRGKKANDELMPLIRLIRAEPKVPVFFPSVLVESPFYDWKAGNQPNSYLFAPLVAYPIDNPLLPLPFKGSDDAREYSAREYVGEILDSRLKGTSEVLFVDFRGLREEWIHNRMQQAGFHATVQEAGNFSFYVFRR